MDYLFFMTSFSLVWRLLSSLVLLSCGEEAVLPLGLNTEISGEVNGRWERDVFPMENIKIVIAEYRRESHFPYAANTFIGYVDSTYTKMKGDYSITFPTSGKAGTYKIFFESTNEFWTGYYVSEVDDDLIGTVFSKDIIGLIRKPITVIVDAEDLVQFPVQILTGGHHVESCCSNNTIEQPKKLENQYYICSYVDTLSLQFRLNSNQRYYFKKSVDSLLFEQGTEVKLLPEYFK